MRLDYHIVRTPFGVTGTAAAVRWYGTAEPFAEFKAQMCVEHMEHVAAAINGLSGEFLNVTTGFREEPRADGGRAGEWWSLVAYA